jgi:hypothetical protein
MSAVQSIPRKGSGAIKENGGGGELNYIFDILQMPQCTPTQHSNTKKWAVEPDH